MFNWLKNKLNSLIPDDVNKGIMTSNFCTIKNGTKINIPKEIVCFINYKDKNYLEIEDGEFVLNDASLPELCSKQRKKNDKLKKIKLDLYFVNTKPFDFKFEYKDKIEINNRIAKVLLSFTYNCNVEDAKKLFESILILEPNPDSFTSTLMINRYIEELLINYFLKKNIDDIILSSSMKQDINNRVSKHLEKIGIKLNTFSLILKEQIKKKQQKELIKNNTGFFSNYNENDSNEKNINIKNVNGTVDQSKQTEYTNSSHETDIKQQFESQNNSSLDVKFCPKCQNKLIRGSKYCHRCGYEINKENI